MISAPEEKALVEQLGGLDLSPFRFHGWLGNRRTKSFGWRYDFDEPASCRQRSPEWLRVRA